MSAVLEVEGLTTEFATREGVCCAVSDVSFRLEKGEILDDPNVPVCTVVAPRTEEVAAPVAEAVSTEPELIRKPKAEDGDDDKE